MNRQNRFFLMPVLVTALAVIAMFRIPTSDAGDTRAIKTAAEACPYAAKVEAHGGSADNYHHWLMMHVHGLQPAQRNLEVTPQPLPAPATGLLQVKHSPSFETDAHIIAF